jgi:hypothetical protein
MPKSFGRTDSVRHCEIMEKLNIALILGCARSGTSILGELIGSHPQVNYLFEAHEIWESGNVGENASHRLTVEHATFSTTQRIRDWFNTQRGPATVVVEKNPRNSLRIPFLRAVLPEAQLIHVVRDGRDVACSLMPGIGGDTWKHLKPPSWQKLFTESTGIMRCAHAWKAVLEIALDDLARVPHLQIHYEQLVTQPQIVAQRLLQHLQLPPHPAVQEFCQRVQNATSGSYHAQHQVTWYREDHDYRIGRWRENLSVEHQQMIGDLLQPLLRRLGYEKESAPH